jgi:hypothetical protein
MQKTIEKQVQKKTHQQIWDEVTDKTFLKFKNSLRPNKHTRRGAFLALDRYKEWQEKIKSKKILPSYDLLVVGDKETIEDNVQEFMTYERDIRGLSSSMRSKSATSLKKFFTKNRAGLTDDFWRDIIETFLQDKKIPRPVPYEVWQIQEILKHCLLKETAMILLLKDTGFRIEVIPRLKLGHLNKIKIGTDANGNDLFIFRIGPIFSKTRDAYPFCTPETYLAIMEYLKYRQVKGERLDWGNPRAHNDTRYGNLELANTGSVLFRNDRDLSKKTEYEKNNPEPIADSSIGGIIANLVEDAGIQISKPNQEGKNRYQKRNETPAAHGLREFAINQMKKVEGASIEKQMCLTGHAIGVREHYAKYSQDELLEEFKKCIKLLTITKVAIKDMIIEKKNIQIVQLMDDNIGLKQKEHDYEILMGRGKVMDK